LHINKNINDQRWYGLMEAKKKEREREGTVPLGEITG
jgi:hypothetical protein